MIFKLWMRHSVYERDKLSNKEQIESAVSGNIKTDSSTNRDTECSGDAKLPKEINKGEIKVNQLTI